MIGYFIVDGFTGSSDSAGFKTSIKVSSAMDMNIKGTLYLPPYLRKSQCKISEGDKVFGVMDDITGIGCAMFGENGADYKYFFDADVEIKKNLTVTKDIESSTGKITASLGNIIATVGDVKAANVSLKAHMHPILVMQSADAALAVASASSGSPAEFTTFITSVPGVIP